MMLLSGLGTQERYLVAGSTFLLLENVKLDNLIANRRILKECLTQKRALALALLLRFAATALDYATERFMRTVVFSQGGVRADTIHEYTAHLVNIM